MQSFVSFCVVYRQLNEEDEKKWATLYEGYTTFAEALRDVLTVYQYRGMLVDCGWFIYGVQANGTKVKLDEDGTPIPLRTCPSG